MTLSYLFILALVQGLTEFLPVSSSGHLALLPHLLGAVDQGITIDISLHVGTLLAILIYYHRDILTMAFAVLRWRTTPHKFERNLAVYIVLATIPAVVVGVIVHKMFPDGIRSVPVIAFNTIVFGVLMGYADYKGARVKSVKDMTLVSAMIMGCAQALALVPGVSRSGITMTAGRFLGFTRADAARFSFLLGTPAMVGAALLDFKDVFEKGVDAAVWADIGIAIGLSFVFGLCAIHFMMKWLQKFGLTAFMVYRLVLGAFLLVYLVN